MDKIKHLILIMLCCLVIIACKEKKAEALIEAKKADENIRKKVTDSLSVNPPEGMLWIPAGLFLQGAVQQDKMAMSHEKPQHPVRVDGFFMDITEVTNAAFRTFVKETGYVTIAEREIDWEAMKKQLPEG
ncbi:SUMF1/EgtB/PvdO family nonheme iron enzyme, partial [Algibacter sp.]|nr:SUMF1/EgtB/PvdO family nonheme iron enzyme [Algibacter sp.]